MRVRSWTNLQSMAFVPDLDSIHNPATAAAIPSAWGDAVNENFRSFVPHDVRTVYRETAGAPGVVVDYPNEYAVTMGQPFEEQWFWNKTAWVMVRRPRWVGQGEIDSGRNTYGLGSTWSPRNTLAANGQPSVSTSINALNENDHVFFDHVQTITNPTSVSQPVRSIIKLDGIVDLQVGIAWLAAVEATGAMTLVKSPSLLQNLQNTTGKWQMTQREDRVLNWDATPGINTINWRMYMAHYETGGTVSGSSQVLSPRIVHTWEARA